MSPSSNNVLVYGGLLTAIKSGWELSRMIRKKLEDIRMNKLVANARQSLTRAFYAGCIDSFDYYKYNELIHYAEVHEDGMRCRALLEEDANKLKARQLRSIWNKMAKLRASVEL